MAKTVTKYQSAAVHSAPSYLASGATLLEGVFVGVDSSGNCRPGDFRVSGGPIIALGVALHNARLLDPKANVLQTMDRISWTGGSGGATKVSGFSGLTPGKEYFLLSGGDITGTKPATTVNDIDQVVGIAVSASELLVQIGSPVRK